MINGVINSQFYVLFVTDNCLTRPYVLLEARVAMKVNKPIILIKENRYDNYGNFTLNDIKKQCPKDLLNYIFNDKNPIINYESYNPIKMYNDLIRIFKIPNFDYNKINFSTIEPDEVDILLIGDNNDVCGIIKHEINQQGVSCSINNLNIKYKYVVLFLNKNMIQNTSNNNNLDFLKDKNNIVVIYEDDIRRNGFIDVNEIIKLSSDSIKFLFDKFELMKLVRRDLSHTIENVIKHCALKPIPKWIINNSIDSTKLQTLKAQELEIGTREWLFKKIKNEFYSNSNTNVIIILAAAGMGKSVTMGKLVENSLNNNNGIPIIAYHFFHHKEQPKAKSCIFSLCKQFCSKIPGFRTDELDNELDYNNITILELFQKLIIKPLSLCGNGSIIGKNKKVGVVIDALDECLENDEFVKILKDEWIKLPKWLILITTSRPQDNIATKVKNFDPIKIEASQDDNLKDINEMLEKTLLRQGVNDNLILKSLSEQAG